MKVASGGTTGVPNAPNQLSGDDSLTKLHQERAALQVGISGSETIVV
jgi:hypothetical protein